MSSKSKPTKEEIAKRFDLPERQSKIESLLGKPEIYCVCRSSDSTSFMIACGACEEWYHGECVNITESEAKKIHHYYCQWCIEKHPNLKIDFKKKHYSGGLRRHKSSKREKKAGGRRRKMEKSQVEEKVGKVKRCGACTGCFNRRDCGRCENCKRNRRKDLEKNKKKTCLKRMCLHKLKKEKESRQKSTKEESSTALTSKQVTLRDEEDDWTPTVMATTGAAATGRMPKSVRRSKKKVESRARESDLSQSSDNESQGEEPKQCYWYECLNAARSGSKYCSDECGLRLAKDRILKLLPSRIQEWNLTPSVAEEKNKKELEVIRRKQQNCRAAIGQLEHERTTFDSYIERSRMIEINPDRAEEEVEEEEGSIPCVTCGHEVSVKTCIKHMERCYNKYESQASFGSAFKSDLVGAPIFCDFFHPASRTYCKRLQVLCPEHTKEPKIRDTAICGYPLSQNVTGTGPNDKICKISKKKCNRHHCWEKLRRAEIDLEKVRYWMKLDVLIHQERQCKQALTESAGVLGLLLHSTVNHEIQDKHQKEVADAELNEKQRQDNQQPVLESPENAPIEIDFDDPYDERDTTTNEEPQAQ